MLLWKDDLNFEILSFSSNFINEVLNMNVGGGLKCHVTRVYGPLEASGSLKQENKLSWLLFRDFNEILVHSEKWGGKDSPEK